ncbi:hypothetical protein D9613_003331 [Agrocybe pediades]|uniref:DUF6699 domain-containing protein n=1 Tax=Agrocybe pediades TaxID=84607 RepID=A0A8H4QP75_9AGAR|nr:hypothetical protein D9613_003331 [Agrocybe pediades]KAF9557174.1 hypothetical protein CPC08DRAFT_710546 [Agrocybe pediades]
MAQPVSRWAPGPAYGPVLSQTDLYLLQSKLDINPILDINDDTVPLQFHLVTGAPVSSTAPGRPSEVPGKDEPATLPRVNQLILISYHSPWCTIIRKEGGVTVGDVCSTIYREYSDNDITDAEFNSLSQRVQDGVKRAAATHAAERNPQAWGAGYYTPHMQPERLKRLDWLKERVFLEGIERNDNYAKQRLGFSASNIFIMNLAQ